MLSNYKTIFFDIDGVLLSSTNYYATIFKETADELGADPTIPLSFYHQRIGIKMEEWILFVIPKENHKKVRALFDLKSQGDTQIHHFPIINGANEVLENLKNQNKNIALITTRQRTGIDILLEEYNWGKFVDFSVSGDEVVHFKPHPEGTLRALDYFQSKPEEVMFIGDSLHDLGAAREAGTDFLGVLTGVCSEDDWNKEDVDFVESVKILI